MILYVSFKKKIDGLVTSGLGFVSVVTLFLPLPEGVWQCGHGGFLCFCHFLKEYGHGGFLCFCHFLKECGHGGFL